MSSAVSTSSNISCADLLAGRVPADTPVTLKGWVRTRRDSKAGISFVHVSDGSSFHPVQVVVPDTLLDERFADNPLVVDGPRIRFYAGAPLMLRNGTCLGTLCIVDTRPRNLSAADLAALHDLRDMALEQLIQTPAAPA